MYMYITTQLRWCWTCVVVSQQCCNSVFQCYFKVTQTNNVTLTYTHVHNSYNNVHLCYNTVTMLPSDVTTWLHQWYVTLKSSATMLPHIPTTCTWVLMMIQCFTTMYTNVTKLLWCQTTIYNNANICVSMLDQLNNNLLHYVMMCRCVPTMCTDVHSYATLLQNVTMKCTIVFTCYNDV